jgi:hypothetical protein
MSALTSLLVRDRVVPVSKIEQALHAQVFQGGDIEVILLEMGVVPEDVLSAYRAALFDLLPATRDEVMKASREVLRRVPAELARSLGIAPIFFEGRTLVVAAWEPLYEPRLGELEAQLGCEVNVRIVNQARLASALSHHYGFELEPRLRRLSDSLRKRHPGVVPYVRPPTQSMRPLRRNEDEDDEELEPARSRTPSAPELAYAQVEARGLPAHEPDPPDSLPAEPLPPVAPAPEPVSTPAVEASEDDDLPTGVSPQLAAIIRGPVDLERAIELLQVTSKRDDVLYVLLRYVQHAFDFVCVFSIGRDGKEGARARMAHGAGVTREIVEHVVIPEPREGVLAAAIRERRPVLGEFGLVAEEREAARALHRERGRSGLFVPVLLNDRVVLVVHAERVRLGLGLGEAAVIHALVPAVTASLRRLILAAKADRQRTSLPPPSAPQPVLEPVPTFEQDSLAALEAALNEPAEEPLPLGPPLPVAAQENLPLNSFEQDGLRAVDLDAFEREARDASADAAREAPVTVESRDQPPPAQRLAGVPRPPPPPPAYEAPVPVQANTGYRQRGAAHAQAVTERAVPQEQPVTQERAVVQAPAEEERARLSLVEPTVEMPSVIIDMG